MDPSPREAAPRAASRPQPKLLLIDDDAATLEVMVGAFERRGIAVVACGDSRAVTDTLASDAAIGAIVTDLRMPGVDGFEVLRRARAWGEAHGASVPVFVVTGHGTTEEEQRALDLGAALFLRKPLDLPVLLGHVRAALQPGEPRS
jgi:DNA-binding response OmpR family regulator